MLACGLCLGGALAAPMLAQDGSGSIRGTATTGFDAGVMPEVVAGGACVTVGAEDDHPFAWWALSGSALATMLLWGATRWLDRRRRQRERDLEEMVALRTAELERSREQLESLAYLDPLTNLPNRRQFKAQLRRLLHEQKQGEGQFAMLLIKLDALRHINEIHGHTVGDAALHAVGELLAATVRDTDVACHLSGNEFAILLGKVADSRTIDTICARVMSRLHEPLLVCGNQVQLDAHVGVVPCLEGTANPDDVLNAADNALKEARGTGTNTWRWGVADSFTFTA